MINIHCPMCGGHLFEGDACGSCHVPAKVIESIYYRDKQPRFVGVLGPSGVGKTVYLGVLLDLLSRGVNGLHGAAKGAFSLALHRNVVLSLEEQRFPDKTPNESDHWEWVHCEVTTGKKTPAFDIVTPDVAGEAVMVELENPRSNETIRALLGSCSALVVLADIVFTKADLFDGSTKDPEAFARANAPSLWRLCESRLKHCRFYCSGVAGATGRLIDVDGSEVLVPLRVEPRGIIEPFAWLLSLIA